MATEMRGHANPNMDQTPKQIKKPGDSHDYKGFVAGVFSGIAKLTGMEAFTRISPVLNGLLTRSSSWPPLRYRQGPPADY